MTARSRAALEREFDVLTIVGASAPDQVMRDGAGRIRGIAGGKVTGAMMAQLPNLEIIANSGVGVDSNDMATARARGISVTNTPDVLNHSVAELAVALMLGLARSVPQSDRFVRDGDWKSGAFRLGSELRGKTVGMLGLGRIGKEIAQRLVGFGMEVHYYGRTRQADQPFEYHADLVEMATLADWLVVIAPANAETSRIVSRDVLEALGPEGRLVNIARGSLVDQDALIACLEAGKLRGAALDVFDNEPNVAEALCRLENVVLSPHQGSRTEEAREAMDALVVDNLRAHFVGRTPPNLVV